MIKVLVEKGKKKTIVVKPSDLMSKSLQEIISEKLGRKVSQDEILSFDGKKAEYMDGERLDFLIPETELLDQSIRQWVSKKLKTRSKLNITILDQGK